MSGLQPYAMPAEPAAHYGTQRRVSQSAGSAKVAQLLECGNTQLLWRVTATAVNGLFELSWGTYGTSRLVGLRSPLAITIPGAFTLQVHPIDSQDALEAVAAVSVASGGVSVARSVVAALGDLGPFAARATALAAATVVVDGSAVPLVAGQELPLVAPCALTVGGPVLIDYAI